MPDDKGQFLAADSFVPVAEENALIHLVDRWVVKHSAVALAEQHRAGRPMSFFIKVSVDTLRSGDFVDWIRQQLISQRLPPIR